MFSSQTRQAAPADRPAILNIHAAAFPTEAESRLVDRLLDSDVVISSIIATNDQGEPVAHVLTTTVTISPPNATQWSAGAIAPIAVHPDHQRRGLGSALMHTAINHARKHNIPTLFLLGDPAYYTRFGFISVARFGLHCKWPCPPEAFMALPLADDLPTHDPSATVEYHPLFDALDS